MSLDALKVAGWGALSWSGEGATRGALHTKLENGYALEARLYDSGKLEVLLSGGGDASYVSSPDVALEVVEKWERKHAERALAASCAADELRAMVRAAT